jgi:hypothetical protein
VVGTTPAIRIGLGAAVVLPLCGSRLARCHSGELSPTPGVPIVGCVDSGKGFRRPMFVVVCYLDAVSTLAVGVGRRCSRGRSRGLRFSGVVVGSPSRSR